MDLHLRVLIERDEGGIFVVECPKLSGCISKGKTRQGALDNIRDALEGYRASLTKPGVPIPPPIKEDIVEVKVS